MKQLLCQVAVVYVARGGTYPVVHDEEDIYAIEDSAYSGRQKLPL